VEAIQRYGKDTKEHDEDWLILRFLQNRFEHHDDVRQWLLEKRVPFRKFFDSNWGVHPSPPDIKDAEQLARRAHVGQTDKAGAPYIEHPLRVMRSFTMNGVADDDYTRKSEISDLQIVALLHDTLEDTWVTADFLRRCGYPEHIITAIEALTKLPDEEGSDEGYMRFIARAAQNPLARLVKIADLKDNMNLERIAEPTEKDHARLERYQRAVSYLESLPPLREYSGEATP
jgi:(p)ppGpp synthase/HD superfamily hydrolase